MKKLLVSLLAFTFVLSACGKDDKAELKVGMVTDEGGIDDKSFNQGTWEGIARAVEELGVTREYLKPNGTTDADYITSIEALIDSGHTVIVTPGYKFAMAVDELQAKHPDVKFVCIDFQPGFNDAFTATNTVAILFAEHESGFLAGVAAALKVEEGEIGFIGGQEIPAVQKFNWGFQQGVAYANSEFGTKITMKAEHIVYANDFADLNKGKQLADKMFDEGVVAIFAAAGGTGVGAINAAVERATKGEKVYMIGVDTDQYDAGLIATGENKDKSVMITSAVKYIDTAAFDQIKLVQDEKFEGAKTIMYDVNNGGVGIPTKNPNLSDDIIAKVDETLNKIKSGDIKIETGTFVGSTLVVPEGLIK